MEKCLLLYLSSFICLLSYTQKRYALIIGNGNYQSQGVLKNPLNDVRLLSDKLKDCGFIVDKRENLSRTQLITAINDFFNKIKSEPCVALFYYSGHGIQSDGENYLIPVNAAVQSKTDIEFECMPLGRVLGKMEESQSITNIIILDACRNDPFSKGWYKGEGEKGLTIIRRAPRESYIAFATAPGEIANDGRGSNSPFVGALSKHIVEPGITIEQVFRKVNVDVKKQYPKQVPWTNSSLGIDFYFKRTQNAEPDVISARFMSSANCILYINGDSIGKITTSSNIARNLKPGKYTIRAVSTEYPGVFIEELQDYRLNQYENNQAWQVLPLLNKIIEYQKPKDGSRQPIKAEETADAVDLKSVSEYIKSNMILIEGGEFEMGSSGGSNDESPVHKVQLTSYYLSKYEVTQLQWKSIMGTNPSIAERDCNNCPVDNVSWDEANQFIKKLNHLTGDYYRLPTEAEWEYASRGGKLKLDSRFSGASRMDKFGWYYDNSSRKTHPVGKLLANELGIFDMSGNVAEWCSDWYDISYYNRSESKNPVGPQTGKNKIVRGGSWDDYNANCRVYSRNKNLPGTKNKTVGFRLAKGA